jgi:hypothetical protein
MLSLAASIGASANLIGYNAGDEPQCGGTTEAVPSVVKGISSFDPTRIVAYNQTTWMLNPEWESCLAADQAALRAGSVASFDFYPLTNPWYPTVYRFANGDFLSTHNDSLWIQGLAVQGLAHFAPANQPLWVFVEAGGDNLGFSESNNNFIGTVTSGSNTIINTSGWSKFTAAWLGLTVSGTGIPANTTITKIIDSTHASISRAATSSGASQAVTVTGGASNSDCVESFNICVTQGNEYRPTPIEVNAEAWMSIINGANGIEYFCHDLISSSFCLGDATGGGAGTASDAAAALAVQTNLTYVDHNILNFAPALNATTSGKCSMDSENYTTGALTTAASCTNGVVTLTTSIPATPGAVLVKTLGTSTYVFVQSSRRSTTGAVFTFQLAGLGQKVAKVVYDSVGHYNNTNASLNQTFNLSTAGSFSDTLGANGNDYQVKIYQIQ